MIEISDNGIPFSDNELDQIFEPKLIPAGIGRGSGIELSICREIVRQHEGNISVINKNGYTIFNIYFPGELKAYGTN
jgi:signal transduction histidine kinase